MTDHVFYNVPKEGNSLCILLSSPHSGEEIPEKYLDAMTEQARELPDTDLWIHKLYDFAPRIGIEMVHARYSRYVVDLNRSPDPNFELYPGRGTTGLVPLQTFAAQAIYKDGHEPSEKDVLERVSQYHQPYHEEIKKKLLQMCQVHPKVLLFDAHSIRSQVKTYDNVLFPELILGNNDHQSCPKEVLEIARNVLISHGYEVSVNDPFKGGFITRSMHRVHENCYSIQLEMSRRVYLSGKNEDELDEAKWERIRSALKEMFFAVAKAIR